MFTFALRTESQPEGPVKTTSSHWQLYAKCAENTIFNERELIIILHVIIDDSCTYAVWRRTRHTMWCIIIIIKRYFTAIDSNLVDARMFRRNAFNRQQASVTIYTCRSTVRDLSPMAMLQLGASALVGMLKAHVAHARLIIGTHSIREPCNTKKLTKTMKWRICVVLISVLLLH